MTQVIATVTNDLSTDQRLHKVSSTLLKEGYEVLLVGRQFKGSPAVERPYKTKRMRLLFNSGALFYANYNIRLFWFLLFKRCDILVANDLDTLLPCYLISRIKRIPLIYDTHEYFCGMPELANRPFIRSIWKGIERFIFPKLDLVMTVNDSVAKLYQNDYNKELLVIKNYPLTTDQLQLKSKKELGLPENKGIILYQGAVNVNRGLEEAVKAMHWVEDAVLIIIGGGNALNELKKVVNAVDHSDKIVLTGWLPFEELAHYTRHADVGLAIEKDNSLNYKYSLSNKVFDYIHSELPFLSSRLIENEQVLTQWNIGALIDNHNPRHIAEKLTAMLNDESQREAWAENLKKAKIFCNWERQESLLLELYSKAKSA